MRSYELGQKVTWVVRDIPFTARAVKHKATITEVHEDHAIATTADGMNLWIDDDTEADFEEV